MFMRACIRRHILRYRIARRQLRTHSTRLHSLARGALVSTTFSTLFLCYFFLCFLETFGFAPSGGYCFEVRMKRSPLHHSPRSYLVLFFCFLGGTNGALVSIAFSSLFLFLFFIAERLSSFLSRFLLAIPFRFFIQQDEKEGGRDEARQALRE